MSIRTVNVGLLNPLALLALNEITEGPPFYSGLRLKLTIAGARSYTDTGLTYSETFSYSKEVNLDRAALELDTEFDPAAAEDGLSTFDFDSGFFVIPVNPASGFFCVSEKSCTSHRLPA